MQDTSTSTDSTFVVVQRSLDGGPAEGQLTLDGDVVREREGVSM